MNKRRIWSFLLALIGCLVFLPGCSSKSQAEQGKGLKIVTSFYPMYALVKEVSGDLNDVRMIESGGGIHSFEPSANDVAAIYDADVFIYHSASLESWARSLDPSLQKSSVKVIQVSEEMELDKVAGLEEIQTDPGQDEKSLYDPHSWLDPEKAGEEAQIIADQLSKLDRQHEAVYQEHARKFKAQARELTRKYQRIFENAKQKTFVTQHTAFAYLAKRFGLTQLGIAGISPDQEPSPRQLAEIQEFVKSYQVRTVFVESAASPKLAATIAQSTGVQLKVLNPLEADPENDKTYLANLEENLQTLAEDLKG